MSVIPVPRSFGGAPEVPTGGDEFRRIADILCVPLAVVAASGRYDYVNPAFTALFGYTLDDVPDGRLWFRRAFPDETRRREAIAAWRAHVARGDAARHSPQIYPVACRDGAVRHILFRAAPRPCGGHVVVYEDLSDRLRADAREEDHRRSLMALSELLGGLSLLRELDDLCRAAVERAPAILGVDRMALWFRTPDPAVVAGTFGVDEQGALRDERASRLRVSTASLMGRVLY